MSLAVILLMVIATIVIVWLIQQGHIPAPFHWIVIAILVVIWLYVLANAAGLHLGKPLAQVGPSVEEIPRIS